MTSHRCRRTSWYRTALLLGAVALTGCQSYQRAPLDLRSHRAAFDARALQNEPIEAFNDRLRAGGIAAPERFDLTDGLTVEEGEVLALFYNADLRLRRMRAGVTLANAENAGLFEDPVFGFNGAEIVSPSAPFEYGLRLELTIPVSGRLGAEKDRAGARHEAELRSLVDAEWRTRAKLRQAWAEWSASRERAALLTDIVAQIERIGAVTDRLEAGGEISRVESRLFRIERVNRSAQLLQAGLDVRAARNAVSELLGIPSEAPITLVADMTPPTVEIPDDPLARLIESNTALAIRRAEYQVAEDSLRLEIRKQFPDINLGGGFGSEDNDDRLLLGVSVPIPILNGNRAAIAEATAQRGLARAAAETTFERLARAINLAIATLEATTHQRESYETEVVPLLDEQFGEIQRIAELGEVDTLLLLETVGRQFDAKSRLLELLTAEVNAATTIAMLLGPEHALAPAPIEPSEQTVTTHDAAEGGEQ